MKLVSIDSTGIYIFEIEKKDNLEEITKSLEKQNKKFYIEEKYNQITILK